MDVPLQIALRKWCELLDIHGGRDKIIRVTGYICSVVSDLPVIIFLVPCHLMPNNLSSYQCFQGIRDTPLSKKATIIAR